MHYFKMNIGDYAKKAGRLSMLEHGAYTLLIHACYDRERFPSLEEALEWCWVRTDEEEAAVKFVLKRFFTFENGVYVQNRIREEIEKYHETAETNKRIATEREEKRRCKARTVHEPCKSVNEPPPNQEPITINQEPSTPIERGSKVLNEVGGKPENPPSQENHSFFINKGSVQSLIPLDFQPDEACIRYAKSNEIVLEIELERFKNHYIATGSTRANWHAQFKKWLMDTVQKMAEIEKKSQSPPNNHQKYKKYNALDAINGGDGYGNKRPEQGAGRIIDIGGGLAEERPGIQKLISN
jgi:uncharacterized protein YdaU (DUF1376 family)